MKPISRDQFSINHEIAKNLAEARWGRGGTTSYRTNRKGVYYFSCSSHGGYVVDLKALTSDDIKEISQYISFETMEIVLNDDYVFGYFNPFTHKRNASVSVPMYTVGVRKSNYHFYLFEEDCDWAILEKFTDIRRKDGVPEEENQKYIADTFYNWYDPESPVVKERKELDEMRKNRHPNLIIAALRSDDNPEQCFVCTADDKYYLVENYKVTRYNLLSNTKVIREAVSLYA